MFPHYTWGYIVLYLNPGEKRYVPSLYVRVYRALFCPIALCPCSLTIREGISPVFWIFETFLEFPHYTWGYIAPSFPARPLWIVPSLYVRVYRRFKLCVNFGGRSLTIREGISRQFAERLHISRFPHYTWGYIGESYVMVQPSCVPSLYVRVYRLAVSLKKNSSVPSLYVRVYRDARTNWQPAGSSLTIREGISQDSFVVNLYGGFPHYTWGYIICRFPHLSFLGVPSLYVRVYRSSRCTIRQNPRSITIREGISLSLRETSLVSLFPHYTWGYIEKKCKKRRKNCVPSLYVRVYWSFSLLSESLILKM